MEDNIANPRSFPPPRYSPSTLKVLNIIDEATGKGFQRDCLISIDSKTGEANAYYEISRKLRECIYGEVRGGIKLTPSPVPGMYKRSCNQTVAIKISSKARLSSISNQYESPIKEISAFQLSINHENIINFIEATHDDKYIYTITEYCEGGELFDLIKSNGALSESEGRIYFHEILSGLKMLASKCLAHRDLTLENILLKDNKCKIMDFGMCILFPINSSSGDPKIIFPQGVCGKKNYIAPEVIENLHPFYPHLTDIWSLGVILFILLTGYPPVEAATPLDPRYRMIRDGHLNKMLREWNVLISSNAVDLMQKLLKANPLERIGLDDILEHPWMKETH